MYILKPRYGLIYINLYHLHLYLLIHLLYVFYSASICHVGISATEKQYYYQIIKTIGNGFCYLLILDETHAPVLINVNLSNH